MLKLNESFRDQDIFIISLFFNSSDLGFESFRLIFPPLGPDPWIRLFLRIRVWIQENIILWIQRIRIRILRMLFRDENFKLKYLR